MINHYHCDHHHHRHHYCWDDLPIREYEAAYFALERQNMDEIEVFCKTKKIMTC